MKSPAKPKARRRGRFIVLEGPDGVGKTTQTRLVSEALAARGIELASVREPGGTVVGEKIREILLDRKHSQLTPTAEAFLFEAARAQVVVEKIRPALAQGNWVITDRYSASTFVYQGSAGGVRRDLIEAMSDAATGGLWPDCYVILDMSEREALERKRRLGGERDRMESKSDGFRRRVFRAYREFARRHAGRVSVVKATGTPEQVRDRILAAIGRCEA